MLKVVSQIFYYNQAQQYPKIQQDYRAVKDHVDKTDSIDENIGKAAIGTIPTLRRISSLPDKLQNEDFIPAAGLTAVAIMQLPEDLNDAAEGFKHAKSFLTGNKYEAKYENKVAQHEFSFLRNSLLEKWYKVTKSETVKKFVEFLGDNDDSLYKTKFGKFIRNLAGIEEGDKITTKMKTESGRDIFLNKIEAKGLFGDLTARAMKRTTILGLGALVLLEVPKIYKAMGQGDNIGEQASNTTKQTVKSGINIASITAGIAYCGAIGAKHGKAFGSLVGMGLGATFGALVSQKTQSLVG
jgi:hypothetical protein